MAKVKTEFLDLNDRCLEHVFNFCDVETIIAMSKVCKRLNALVTTIHFPKQTKLSRILWTDENRQQFREILNCIGEYLVDVEIFNAPVTASFYQFLGHSMGNRIRKLIITSSQLLETSLAAIEPILQRLESLELCLSNEDSCDDGLELRSRCSNLRKLHIQWDTRFIQNTGNWPFLEELILGNNEYILEDTFRQFMQNNQQLRKLKIGCFNCDVKLNDIAQYLVNLEHLVVFQGYSDLSADSILELQRLTHLKRLYLRDVETDFDDIVNNATKLNGLVELQVQAKCDDCSDDELFKPKHQTLVGVALQMSQLQVFGISYCRFKDETILEFIQFAVNLREIHIHYCDFELTPSTIEAIINTRNQNCNRIDPLVIHTNNIDDDLLETLKQPNIKTHIIAKICANCEIMPDRFFD